MIPYNKLTETQFKGLFDIGLLFSFYPEAHDNWSETPQAKSAAEKENSKRESRKQPKKKNEDLTPQIRDWIRRKLEPGMRVKMAGCRDGEGIREVLEIIERPVLDYSGNPAKFERMEYEIECRQIFVEFIEYGRYKDGVKVFFEEESKGQITNHLDTKLRKVWVEDKWVDIKDLL